MCKKDIFVKMCISCSCEKALVSLSLSTCSSTFQPLACSCLQRGNPVGIHIYSSYLYSYPQSKLELFITARAVILFGIQIQRDSKYMINISQIQSWPVPGWEKPEKSLFLQTQELAPWLILLCDTRTSTNSPFSGGDIQPLNVCSTSEKSWVVMPSLQTSHTLMDLESSIKFQLVASFSFPKP